MDVDDRVRLGTRGRRTAAPAIALGLMLSGFASEIAARPSNPNWPMYQGGKEHRGHVPVHLDPSGFAEMWSIQVSTLPLNPVAAGGGMVFATPQIFFDDVDQVVAIDAGTGVALWNKAFGRIFWVSPPAYADFGDSDLARVLVQTEYGLDSQISVLRAFEARTGNELFEVPTELGADRPWAPTIDGREVFANAGSPDGVCAFGALEPLVSWCLPLNDYDGWTPAVDAQYVYAYTGEYEPKLSIVSRTTGIEERSIPDPNFHWNGWRMNLAPVLGERDDVVSVQGGRLLSFDLSTDSIRFELGPNDFTGQPAVAHGMIFTIGSGALTARGEETGDYLWGWAANFPLIDAMLVTDSHVVVRTEYETYAVGLESHVAEWSFPRSGSLAWSEGVLYIAGEDGVLTAISAASLDLFRDGFETGDFSAWTRSVE